MNRIKRITRGGPIKRLRNQQLLAILDLSVQYGLSEPADKALSALRYRKGIAAEKRFDLAMKMAGLVSATSLHKPLSPVTNTTGTLTRAAV